MVLSNQEESKENTDSQKDIEKRVKRIMVVIDPPKKKVAGSKDFRSFLKNQTDSSIAANSNDVMIL